MTDSLADILQAVSVGQGLTSTGRGFAKSQSWRNALEEAHVRNEWIMQAHDEPSGGTAELSPRSPGLRQPETMVRLDPSGQRLEVSTRPLSRIDAETALNQAIKPTVNTGVAGGRFANAMPGAGLSSTQVTLAPTRGVAPAKPVAPPAQPSTPTTPPGPRSVNLLTVNGGVHVVIRDEALKGPTLPKLVARVRELIASFGEEVSKIIVNGREVWSDPAKPGQPSDDESQATIEILF